MLLKVEDLRKSFAGDFLKKPREVLRGVSFSVAENRTVGFIGANGSGKTTSIKCILGFIQKDSGRIELLGQDHLSCKSRAGLGFLPERPYYYTFLTGLEFLKFFWSLNNLKGNFKEEAARALKSVDLWAARDLKLKQYSKGMLQRVGIAQALIKDPKMLIFDEPMSGLDPDGRILIKEILKEQKEKGVTILFSSHLLHDMEQLCDEILVIDQGKLLFEGPIESLRTVEGQDLEKAFGNLRLKNQLLNQPKGGDR